MLEILFMILVVFYFVFWVYSLYTVINLTTVSSRTKLLLILSLIVLQPAGLLAFWSYKILSNKKAVAI